VFAFNREFDALLVAESFPDWMRALARRLRSAAAAVESGRNTDFSRAFHGRFLGNLPDGWGSWTSETEPADETPDIPTPAAVVLTTDDALDHPDPVIAELARQLPTESFIADLRDVSAPVFLPFSEHRFDFTRFRRINGGEFLVAVDEVDGEEEDEED
jgi:hypothetical protein